MSGTPPNSPHGAPDLMDNLSGALDVMLGRETGLSRMDLRDNGFWTSFAGLLLAGLIDASALSLIHGRQLALETAVESKLFFILGHLLVALIAYAASLLALYLACKAPTEQGRVPTAVIVHNWASPIISLAFLPIIFLAGIMGSGSGQADTALNMMSVFRLGLLIFIGLRIMRISLDVSLSRAAGLFAVTTIVSLVCSEGLERLIGLNVAS